MVDYQRSQEDYLISTLTLDRRLGRGIDDVFEKFNRERSGACNDLALFFGISEREYGQSLGCFQLDADVLTFHEPEQVQIAEIEFFFDCLEIFLVFQTKVGQAYGGLGDQILLFVVVEDDHEVVETIGLSQIELSFLVTVQPVQIAQHLNTSHGR